MKVLHVLPYVREIKRAALVVDEERVRKTVTVLFIYLTGNGCYLL